MFCRQVHGLAALLLLLLSCTYPLAAPERVLLRPKPELREGVPFVPAGPVLRLLGAQVAYLDYPPRISAVKDNVTTVIEGGKAACTVGGVEKALGCPTVVTDRHVMASVGDLCQLVQASWEVQREQSGWQLLITQGSRQFITGVWRRAVTEPSVGKARNECNESARRLRFLLFAYEMAMSGQHGGIVEGSIRVAGAGLPTLLKNHQNAWRKLRALLRGNRAAVRRDALVAIGVLAEETEYRTEWMNIDRSALVEAVRFAAQNDKDSAVRREAEITLRQWEQVSWWWRWHK